MLIVLIGVPGSGKTWLSELLERELCARVSCTAVRAVHMDDFYEGADVVQQSGAYSEGRQRAAERARELLCREEEKEDKEDVVVVLDDTHYYRSMRKQAVQLARACGVLPVFVWCRCSLELALQRNEARGCTVPQSVVQHMWDRFEPPTQKGWDVAFEYTGDTDALFEHLQKAWKERSSVLKQQQEPKPVQNYESLQHRVDIALRKELGALVSACSTDKKALAASLNEARRNIVARIPNNGEHANEEAVIEDAIQELRRAAK